MSKNEKPGFGRVFLVIGGCFGLIIAIAHIDSWRLKSSGASNGAAKESYRLIQALGNTEHESARGLSRQECELRKSELKAIGEAVGIYNERLGIGSITCLPESYFKD